MPLVRPHIAAAEPPLALAPRRADIQDAVLIIDKKRIAWRYAAKWFPIDLLGSIPWELLFRIYEATQPEVRRHAPPRAATRSVSCR